MRSQDSVTATSSERTPAAPVATTSGWAVVAVVALLLAIMLWPLFKDVAGANADSKVQAGVAPACARWDELAGESIARLVQEGRHDADLQRVSDAVFRLRRARRNCQAGWIALACQDYSVIIRRVPGFTAAWPRFTSVCALTADREATATAR